MTNRKLSCKSKAIRRVKNSISALALAFCLTAPALPAMAEESPVTITQKSLQEQQKVFQDSGNSINIEGVFYDPVSGWYDLQFRVDNSSKKMCLPILTM